MIQHIILGEDEIKQAITDYLRVRDKITQGIKLDKTGKSTNPKDEEPFVYAKCIITIGGKP